MRLLSLVLLLGVMATGCRPEHNDPEALFGQLNTIVFGGDTVLARRMNRFVQEEGFGRPLEGVQEILAGADVAVINLEAIIASTGEPAKKGREPSPYYFRARPELVGVLVEAGVDVASLGNNHGGDYGPEAVIEGVGILREAGIDPIGGGSNVNEAMAPVFRKVGDNVVAFIALDMTQESSEATTDRGGVHFVSESNPGAVVDRVREQVQLARRFAHLVFLVTHWGKNYDEEPGENHRNLARRLVREAGIDGLLGTSAHQFQGVEVIEGRPIIYDAGDLIFDFDANGWTHKSVLFELHFDREGVRWVEAIPIRLGWGTAALANEEEGREIIARLDDLSKRLGTRLWLDDQRARMGLWNVRRRPSPREEYHPPPRKIVVPEIDSYIPPGVVLKALPSSATPLNVEFEEGYELLGYELPQVVRGRRHVRLVTYWRTKRSQQDSYQILVYVDPPKRGGDANWRRAAHQPGDWMYPTTRWSPGEIIRDSYYIRAPKSSTRGTHVVSLKLFKGSRRPRGRDGVVKLGTFEVR